MPLSEGGVSSCRQERIFWFLHHVTIDDLGKTEFTSVRHEVEALRLDASRVHGLPFQVIAGELRVGISLGLDADRLDGRRTVDGLRSPCDVGQPDDEEANKSDDRIAAMRVGSLDPCDGHILRLLRPLEHDDDGM